MGEIKYRLARIDDREKIISLLNDVFSSQQKSERVRTLDSWKWKNEENVFDETLTVIADHEGDIVGTGTLWPFTFLADGRTHLAYQTCSLAVAKDYRGQGVFRNINRVRLETARERNASFLFSFPNSNSLPGYKKMGWSCLGKIPWFVKPLKPFKILRDKLSDSQSSMPHPLEEDDLLKHDQVRFKHDLKVDDELVLKKGTEFYNWRYVRHPFFKYGFLTFHKTDDHTFGAVYSILDKGSCKEMVIIDIIAETPEMTVSILNKTEEVARKYDVMFIALMAPYGCRIPRMLKSGYLPYYMKNLAVYTLNSTVGTYVEDIKKWSFFAGLHDSI